MGEALISQGGTMRILSRLLAVAATAVAIAGVTAPAEARCTRLAFSVNDYGKDGPTKDAKKMLESYIADWAAKQGIKRYAVSKRDVSCELFLDFIVFDEHTCKASALVCWGDGAAPKGAAAPGSDSAAPAAASAPPAAAGSPAAPKAPPAKAKAAPAAPKADAPPK